MKKQKAFYTYNWDKTVSDAYNFIKHNNDGTF